MPFSLQVLRTRCIGSASISRLIRLLPIGILTCSGLASAQSTALEYVAGPFGLGSVSVESLSETDDQLVFLSGSADRTATFWSAATGAVEIDGVGNLPSDVNAAGQVAGTRVLDGVSRAYLWSVAGGLVDLGDLGGGSALASKLDGSGQVVGSSTNADGDSRAFRWSAATGMVDLGTLGGSQASARDINESGDIVGWSLDSGGSQRATLWRAGTALDLGLPDAGSPEARYINEAAQIVGVADASSGPGRGGFFWDAGNLLDIGPPDNGIDVPVGLNEAGEVAGFTGSFSTARSFFWSRDTGSVDIGDLGGPISAADIGRGGVIVGEALIDSGGGVAFRWSADGGLVVLRDLVADSPSVPGFLSEAESIADNGTVLALDGPDLYVLGEVVTGEGDLDGDGVADGEDNCSRTPNADQANFDGDELGDVCDPDDDNDGVPDDRDQDPFDPSVGEAVVVRVRSAILSGADDVEQRAGGRIAFDSSDLELVEDGGFAQRVGLRFARVAIPQGVDIISAYLEFVIDEVSEAPTELSIRGVAADDATRWSSRRGDVSSRPVTAASASWSPAPWTRRNTSGPATRTTDLSSVVTEITGRDDWRSGNAMSFVIEGQGRRVARAFEGNSGAAARLIVDYASPDGNTAPVVDAGADITVPLSGVANLAGSVEDDGLPVPPGMTGVAWRTVSGPGVVSFDADDTLFANATFSRAGRYVLQLNAFDGQLSGFDRVTVSVNNDEGSMVIDRRVSASEDDAEEEVITPGSSGPIDIDSSDLELVDESTRQLVGMRFADLPIPPGSVVSVAYLQFTVDETRSSANIALSIAGQRSGNAPPFASVDGNLTNRPRTVARVDWMPPAWNVVGESGAAQRTPDLSSVIQEIVDAGGWQEGNALVLLIDGFGQRIAESYDGRPRAAPLLHIEYR